MRKKELYRNGMYIWMFHSIWKTPEGEYVDVTQSDVYGNEKIATFCYDGKRNADLIGGTAYNHVIALENEKRSNLTFPPKCYLTDCLYEISR